MLVRWVRRSQLTLGGAIFGALWVSLVEARAAGALDTDLPPLGPLFLAALGLVAPLALVVGLVVAVASLFFEPGEISSPRELLHAVREAPVLERSRTAAIAPLSVIAAFVFVVVTAHIGHTRLAEGKPLEAGVVLGAFTIGLVVVLLGAVLALAPLLRRALAYGAEKSSAFVDPVSTTLAALVPVTLLFAYGVSAGDTSGGGPGPFAILGVLKRPELDLRPVGHALVLAAFGYAAAVGFRKNRIVAPSVALFMVLFGVAATARDATLMNQKPELSRGLARSAPLGKIGLAVLRAATDRDHDGASPLFGGGDCDDHDRARYPEAVDVPGNGIDEDCSGADTPLPAPKEPPKVAAAPKKKRRLNVVLITVDTLRIDLGFMGYKKPVSPNMDRLAEKGAVFERAYAMASYTGKSLGPLLIGKYPSETLRDGGHFNVYSPKNVFVAERAKDAGYATLGAMSHFYFRHSSGLSQGFDRWDLSAIPPGLADNDNSVSSEALSNVVLKMLEDPTRAPQPKDAGASEASDAGVERPFFAWFHYFDPHAQYAPHPEAPSFSDGDKSPAAWVHAQYDAEVWYTDKHIGRVLDAIERSPYAKDTAIVLTADHGEALGDHGMSWHGAEIWESLVRVPLVVYVPGIAPRRIPLKRSHIDLAPTLLELMGVEAGEGELSGQSLVPEVEGEGDLQERDVYVDMPIGPFNGTRRALITGPTPGTKIINLGGSQYQLFDLGSDPGELKDLAKDKEKLEPMKAAMQAYRARLREIEVKPAEN